MTDTPSSPIDPTDDDLLASLYLDDEATPEERATVENDPQLMAQVRAFERIAADLGDVAPPADLQRVQIAAALDLFDQQHGRAAPATDEPGTDQPSAGEPSADASSAVASLADRRAHKAARRGIPSWLSAAAALALVVGGIGFVASRTGNDSDETAGADAATDVSASGVDRSFEETAESAESMLQAEAAESEPMEDSAMEDDSMDDSAMDSDAMEDDDVAEDVMEDSGDEGEADESASDTGPFSPIPLAGFSSTTAVGYLDFIDTEQRLPLTEAPCAESPVVQGLAGFDSFIPVVFNDELASLLLQSDDPTVALIIGLTCEIELE